ncbi:MAG TPA: sugar ABC transporter ATP-binding protein [Ktedonobacteraceae bacterium]|jgi:ribose transport system ATP-binding protein|nr:sugar ABC transporter ATP-binding protein [Ktedonobacteraceae bacterium]
MTSIEGVAISKSFGGVRALNHTSFAADAGEVHALVGENGAGKSTMIKILSGILRPDSGTIRVQGRETTLDSPQVALRLGIGTIFQELTLMPYMTVAENLLIGREPRSGGLISHSGLDMKAHELLDEAGISGIEPLELVANLSLSQRQIVEIIKVVSRRPRILFMDEPTSALAEQEVAWLFGLVRKLREQGTCIVFTSHRWNEIKDIADRITIFRNGENVGTYTAADLSEQEAVERMTGRKLEMLYPEPITLEDPAPILHVEGLSAPALHGISLTVHQGEVLGVGGLAGQGQRELFLTLFGVRHARSGTIQIGGKAVRINNPRDAIRHGLALIPEDRKTEGLLLPLPVRQNLTLPILGRLARSGFIRRQQETDLVQAMIQELAVRTPTSDQPVGALSGGNQQKVLIGRWLLTRSRVLLLYDITRGVDVATKHDIYELIRRLCQEGHAILFYSTDTEEMAHLCHRVLVMREGKIIDELHGPNIAPEAIVAASLHVAAEVTIDASTQVSSSEVSSS